MQNNLEGRSIIDISNFPAYLVTMLGLVATILAASPEKTVTAANINEITSKPLFSEHLRAAFLGEQQPGYPQDVSELKAGIIVTVTDPVTKKLKQVRITAVEVNSIGEIISFSADDLNQPDTDLRRNGYFPTEVVFE